VGRPFGKTSNEGVLKLESFRIFPDRSVASFTMNSTL